MKWYLLLDQSGQDGSLNVVASWFKNNVSLVDNWIYMSNILCEPQFIISLFIKTILIITCIVCFMTYQLIGSFNAENFIGKYQILLCKVKHEFLLINISKRYKQKHIKVTQCILYLNKLLSFYMLIWAC